MDDNVATFGIFDRDHVPAGAVAQVCELEQEMGISGQRDEHFREVLAGAQRLILEQGWVRAHIATDRDRLYDRLWNECVALEGQRQTKATKLRLQEVERQLAEIDRRSIQPGPLPLIEAVRLASNELERTLPKPESKWMLIGSPAYYQDAIEVLALAAGIDPEIYNPMCWCEVCAAHALGDWEEALDRNQGEVVDLLDVALSSQESWAGSRWLD